MLEEDLLTFVRHINQDFECCADEPQLLPVPSLLDLSKLDLVGCYVKHRMFDKRIPAQDSGYKGA